MNLRDYRVDLSKLQGKMNECGITSLRGLSERSSVHRNTIYPLVRGERSPFSESFLSLCAALNSDPISLIIKKEDSERPAILAIVSQAHEEFLERHPTLTFFLFGSRTTEKAKRYSDYDIGVTGGKAFIPGTLFLKIREFVLSQADDLPVKIDVLNFDAAPYSFLTDFDSQVELLSGVPASLAYLQGKIDGCRSVEKT